MTRGTSVLIFFVIGAPLLAYASWRWVLRSHHLEVLAAPQQSGGEVLVTADHSKRLYIGLGKLIGIGGGDARVTLTFEHQGTTVRWTGQHNWKPRLLQRKGSQIYLVSQGDVNSARGKRELHFFCWRDGSWHPIEAVNFPRELATVNLWRRDRDPVLDPDGRLAETLLREQLRLY